MGRPAQSMEDRAAVIAAWRESGLTQREYAARFPGLTARMLQRWSTRVSRWSHGEASFVRVEVAKQPRAASISTGLCVAPAAAPPAALRLSLGGNVALEWASLPEPAWLATLLREVASC